MAKKAKKAKKAKSAVKKTARRPQGRQEEEVISLLQNCRRLMPHVTRSLAGRFAPVASFKP